MRTESFPSRSIKYSSIVILLMIASFVATDIYLPSFPAIATAYHADRSTVQLSLSIFLLGFAISQYVFGVLSDRFGRRPMLLLGIGIYSAASVLILTIPTIHSLVIGRLLQGLGIGSAVSMGRAISRDVFDGKALARMFSYTAIFITLAPAIAPTLGGIIQAHFGYYGNFLFMLLYGLALLLLAFLAIPETNQHKSVDATNWNKIFIQYKTLINHPTFLFHVLSSGLLFSIVMAYSTFNPFFLEKQWGLSPMHYGIVTFLIALGLATGMFFNGQILKFLALRKIIWLGLSILFTSVILLLTLNASEQINLFSYSVVIFLMNLGIALTIPNTASEAFMPFPKMTGLVAATYGCLQILMSTVASATLAIIKNQTITTLGIIILLITVLIISFQLCTRRREIQRALRPCDAA